MIDQIIGQPEPEIPCIMMNNAKNQPLPPRFSPPSASTRSFESLTYRFIEPDEYQSLGINGDDVPMGTFAAMDHPPFLPSRVGGNAYGFGFIEKSYLSEEDIAFLESIEEDDPRELSKHARRINEIYKKLGLLIRVSYKGFRFYLIPINLITHSLQDVKCKADEIERIIIKHVFKKNKERLEVGLLTYENDLIVHELVGRMPTMKFTTFDNLEKLGNYPGTFDLIVLPKNIYEFLFNIIPDPPEGSDTEKQLYKYARYLSGKIYDMLDKGGEFLTIANCIWPEHDQSVEVRFANELELKNFLIYTHLFETKSRPVLKDRTVVLKLTDLYWYLNGAYVYDETLHDLLGDRSVFTLSMEEIENLPYLNAKINETILFQSEETWDEIALPFFTQITRKQILPEYLKEYLDKNVVSSIDLPGTVFLFLGEKKVPPVRIRELKNDVESSGLAGCKLELVARYKNTFSYLLNVLDRVEEILSGNFNKISEVQSYRLRGLFESKKTSKRFRSLEKLLNLRSDLKLLEAQFNPDNLEDQDTPLLENIEKMSLLGLERDILREIVLIVLGHTTLGRVTLGKLPERSLSQVTSRVQRWGLVETISVFRLSLLMTVAEVAASLGDNLSRAQIRELFSVYENILEKITDQGLDWDSYEQEQERIPGDIFKRGIRVVLKLFNLFDFLDTWEEVIKKGPFERDVFCDFDDTKRQEIGKVISLVRATRKLEHKYASLFKDKGSGFLRKIIQTEFHGTGHLFPNLDPDSGLTLLWLAVNAAKGKVVNFNPLIKHTPGKKHGELIGNYHRILSSIRVDELDYDFFTEIEGRLTQEPGFAFVLGTGFQLKYNRTTGALDISHVDIHSNLKSLKNIVNRYGETKISDIPLDQLKKLEGLFTSVYEYYIYAREQDLSDISDVAATAEYFISKENEITIVLAQLTTMFRNQLLEPDRVYDNFTLLLEHCPGMLLYLVPEVKKLPKGNDFGQGEINIGFVLRCFRKLQALVNEDKELFQDHKVFYQIAQQEFGPFTAENVAANQFQIDRLAGIIRNLKEEPHVLKALALSFLLLNENPATARKLACKFGLPEKQATLLETILLHSGVLDSIIHGEATPDASVSISDSRSGALLDSFFIHEVIRMASLKEGRLTEDFLDLCFSYHVLSKKVYTGKYEWKEIENRLLENKIRTISLGDLAVQERKKGAGFGKTDPRNISFQRVRIAATERIFRLAGILWVDYADVLMTDSGVPVTFIYRKKALRSLGMKTFTKQLQHARKICRLLENEDQVVTDYLYTRLARDNKKLYFRYFKEVSKYLSQENWMKLLLLAIKISEELYADTGNHLSFNITFRPFLKNLELRYEILNESLNGLSPSWIVNKCNMESLEQGGINGVVFSLTGENNALSVDFRDPINIEKIISEMEEIEDVTKLGQFFEQKMHYLKSLQFFTRDYQELLEFHFNRRREKLNDRLIARKLETMGRSQDFETLLKRYEELKGLGSTYGFTENQYAEIRFAFEKRQSRLREKTLYYYKKTTRSISSAKELKELWNHVKVSLDKERNFYTREFKLKIAKVFDRRLEEIIRKTRA